jgi:hypothetical protein
MSQSLFTLVLVAAADSNFDDFFTYSLDRRTIFSEQ